MRTKHLCVLIYIRIKGEVGTVKLVITSSNFLTDRSEAVLILRIFFICICLCHVVLPVSCSLVVTCWERADVSALLYVAFCCVFVSFPYNVLGQVWYLIVSIPDLCLLPYFY